MSKDKVIQCPECGSTENTKASKKVRARKKVQRYLCSNEKCLRLFTPPPEQKA